MITSSTRLYCVLGSPVSHSKSPVIHNAAFREHGIDAVYLAFEPPDAKGAVRAIRTLGIKGASVTIPFKQKIMPHLDQISADARQIGAVNTLVLEGGKLCGYNTDARAAVDPLMPVGIQGKTVCIAGAGGAARAVAFGITQAGGDLIITNRSAEKGKALASQFNGKFIPLAEAGGIYADILINTTSLGMTPNTSASPFPETMLKPGMTAMDVVYTPMKTTFLKTAESRGCTIIDGLAMFVAQAAAQFTLWTGIQPDLQTMRKSILTDQGDLT